MKAVAYGIQAGEKEPLIRANNKRHDITLISNRLTLDTISYAQGKEAILVFSGDVLSAPVINKLKELGVKFICTISSDLDHIDLAEASRLGIQVAKIPAFSTYSTAEEIQASISAQTIENLNKWSGDTKVDLANQETGKADISLSFPDLQKTPL